ncbi:MAG: 16S rRNA (cytidine(1402)-2'-O)-methyltransferase [Pseudomonadota bacterium]
MTAANRVKLPVSLYFVATPIGTARDITLRALDVLASADVLVAEDTRSLRRLMEIHGVALEGRPLVSYHEHSASSAREKLLKALADGKSVAYASEAGTPLIADPGFQLGRAAREAGFEVTAAPGATAAITALTISGLPSDSFFFAGFAPNASGQRQTFFRSVSDIPGTLIFYESPNRIAKSIKDMASVFGGDRHAVIARELTKKFEEVLSGTLADLAAQLETRKLKGEIVVLVTRPEKAVIDEAALEALLGTALETQSVKDAVADVMQETGMPRRQIYQLALKLEKEK